MSKPGHVHAIVDGDPTVLAHGFSFIVSGLEALLETGEPPPVASPGGSE